jgi:hypothetical protein
MNTTDTTNDTAIAIHESIIVDDKELCDYICEKFPQLKGKIVTFVLDCDVEVVP